MRIAPTVALLFPALASAQWQPTHDFQSSGGCPELLALHGDAWLGSMCLNVGTYQWDWTGEAFPHQGFRALATPWSPVPGPMLPTYVTEPFDPATTSTIPANATQLYAVDHCAGGQCVEVMALHVQGDSLTWWRAPGLAGLSMAVVDVGDELVFTPVAMPAGLVRPVLSHTPW